MAGLTHLVTHPLCNYKPNWLCQMQGVCGESHQPGRVCSWMHRGLLCTQSRAECIPLFAVGHGTWSVHLCVLRGGSRLGMLSEAFGKCWSFCFPNNFLETVPPTETWDRYSWACGPIRMLFQTGSAENRANRQGQKHSDKRGKNSEITYLQGCTVQEQTYNPYSIFSWKTIK